MDPARIKDIDTEFITSESFTAEHDGILMITTRSNEDYMSWVSYSDLSKYQYLLTDKYVSKAYNNISNGFIDENDGTLITKITSSNVDRLPDLNNPPIGNYMVTLQFGRGTNYSEGAYPLNLPNCENTYELGSSVIFINYNYSGLVTMAGNAQCIIDIAGGKQYYRYYYSKDNAVTWLWTDWKAIGENLDFTNNINSINNILDSIIIRNMITADMIDTNLNNDGYPNSYYICNNRNKDDMTCTSVQTGANNPSASVKANMFYIQPIRISKGVTYYITYIRTYFSFIKYDSETNYRMLDATDKHYNMPDYYTFTAEDDGYIYISTEQTSYPIVNTFPIMSTDLDAITNNITTYALKEKEKTSTASIDNLTKWCKKSGGDYSNLVTAINDLTQGMDNTLYVDEGDWDLVEDFKEYLGNAELAFDESDTTVRPSDIVLKNRIHIIFSPRAYVHYEFNPTTQYYGNTFSPFRSGQYGFTIEGMKLSVTGARYCIHDERSSSADFYNNHYLHCEMYLDNRNNSFGYSQCIGGGLGRHGNITIDNCIFKSETRSSDGAGIVSWHNASAENSCSKIVIRDSYFEDDSNGWPGGIRFSWYGNSNEISTMIITGCNFSRAIEHRAENATSSPIENTRIIEWNNILRS